MNKTNANVVYDAHNLTEAFRGLEEDCLKWIYDQAYKYNNGIYRTWKDKHGTYYDVGPNVYYICD